MKKQSLRELLTALSTSQTTPYRYEETERKRDSLLRTCDALRADGQSRCRATALYPNGRCRKHGGRSTGPRTPEGKARSLAALAAINARRKAAAEVR